MVDILLTATGVVAVLYGIAKFTNWANDLAEDYERED